MTNSYIRGLQKAIFTIHACESTHRGTESVDPALAKIPAWDGDVEVFDLIGHPVVQQCYAWAYQDGVDFRATTVLRHADVDNAERAVLAAIVAKGEKTRAIGAESAPAGK